MERRLGENDSRSGSAAPGENSLLASAYALKALVVLVMIYEHGGIFFDASAYTEKIANVYQHPSWPEFLYRSAFTYLAAPTVFILAGYLSALGYAKRSPDLRQKLRTSWRRFVSLWLMDLLIVMPVYNFRDWPNSAQFYYRPNILSAFALVFVLAPFFSLLPAPALLLAGPATLLCTELLAPSLSAYGGNLVSFQEAGSFLKGALLQAGAHRPYWLSLYPALQWSSFFVAGMLIFRWEAKRSLSRISLLAAVAGFAAIFAVTREFSTIGSQHQGAPATLMEFLQPKKYPISVHYYLLSLSVFFAAWALVRGTVAARVLRPFLVFGRQFTFAYLAHLILLAAVSVLFRVRAPNSLVAAIAWSTLVLLLLFPITQFYERFKLRNSGWWIFAYV